MYAGSVSKPLFWICDEERRQQTDFFQIRKFFRLIIFFAGADWRFNMRAVDGILRLSFSRLNDYSRPNDYSHFPLQGIE
jgi:hypothetical protein